MGGGSAGGRGRDDGDSTSDDDQDDAGGGPGGSFHSEPPFPDDAAPATRRAPGPLSESSSSATGVAGVVPPSSFSSRSDPGGPSASALRRSAARKKPSDGRLLATVVKLIRVSAFLHAVVMAAFLRLRGTPAQSACAMLVLLAAAARGKVQATFGAAGGASSGSHRGGFLMGRVGRRGFINPLRGSPRRTLNEDLSSPLLWGPPASLAAPGAEAHRRGGAFLHFGAGPEASEALASLSSGAESLRDLFGTGREGASSRGGGRAAFDAGPEILLEAGRYAGPPADDEGETMRAMGTTPGGGSSSGTIRGGGGSAGSL